MKLCGLDLERSNVVLTLNELCGLDLERSNVVLTLNQVMWS